MATSEAEEAGAAEQPGQSGQLGQGGFIAYFYSSLPPKRLRNIFTL